MRSLVLVTVLAACGGSSKPAPTIPAHPAAPAPAPAPAPVPAPPASGPVTAQVFCDRFVALSHCEWTKQLMMDHAQCMTTFGGDDPKAKEVLEKFGPCVRDHSDCDEVAQCFSDAAGPADADLRTCEDKDKPGAAVGIAKDEWDHRKGANVTRFSEAKTTKEAPVEVCGIPAENEWLAAATCDDGSHPFASRGDAEAARVGNLGSGGRCGSIIDLYRVKCPEATYDIHLDGYVCPKP